MGLREELQAIIASGENEMVEFKATFNNEAIMALTAFANKKGGKVLIGVKDNGSAKGTSFTEEQLKNALNEIKQKTIPALIPEAQVIEIEASEVLVLSVSEFPIKPVAFRGRYYKRRGASNHELTADEIVEMRMMSLNLSFDAFLVDAKKDNLHQNALQMFERYVNQTGRFKTTGSVSEDLNKLGFIQNGRLTRAAELLFGDHYTNIHIGRFKSPDVIIDDIMVRSPLVTAVDEAMEFIKKSIRLEYHFTGELRRINRWEYPLPALREILLNAIIHKDYRDPTDIIIKIFDDSIEVTNPGKLMGGLTVDALKTDYYHAKHRNKLLAEAFYLMGEIEKYGTGFIRLRQKLKEYPELAYDIIEKGNFIRVLLKNISRVPDKVLNRVSDKVADQLTTNQKKILELIQQNSKISMAQIAEEIGISKRKVLENINKLRNKNLLERVGGTKSGYWKILQ